MLVSKYLLNTCHSFRLLFLLKTNKSRQVALVGKRTYFCSKQGDLSPPLQPRSCPVGIWAQFSQSLMEVQLAIGAVLAVEPKGLCFYPSST